MPPRNISAALRRRAPVLSSSAEEQEAAIKEWRAKTLQDQQALHRISAKIDAHKKSAKTTKREERWLQTCSSLRKEATALELELGKAWVSCAHLLPEVLLKERAKEEELNVELSGFLSLRVMGVRKELQSHLQRQDETLREVLTTLREKISALRRDLAEEKRLVDVRAKELLSEDTEKEAAEDISAEDTLQKLAQSTMATFARLCEVTAGGPSTALVEIYRNALQMERDNAMTQLTATNDGREGPLMSRSDLRTVALVLKTYGNELDSGGNMSLVSSDVYDCVRRVLPHLNEMSAKQAVNEVQRQKRERLRVRSVTLQYKKRSAELLESFEEAAVAEKEVTKMQSRIEEEARAREERRQKTQRELERLRAVRREKDTARRAEEEARRMEDEEKHQEVLRIREAEFQERLRRLREYQEQQSQLQEMERAVQQAIAEENALKRAMQQEHNAKRVEERKREYEEKCLLRKRRQQEVEELNAARKRTLEAFFQGVERRLGVTCDTQRVLQPTVSSQQNVSFVSFSEAAHCNVPGFTADDLMRDPRFRLQLALLEAGLHQTSYGREVLSRGFQVPAAQRPSEDNPLRMEY